MAFCFSWSFGILVGGILMDYCGGGSFVVRSMPTPGFGDTATGTLPTLVVRWRNQH